MSVNVGATFKSAEGDTARTVLEIDRERNAVAWSSEEYPGVRFDGTLTAFEKWADKATFLGYRPHVLAKKAGRA